MKWLAAAIALLVCALVVSIHAQGPAYFVRSLDEPRDRREARADILDTPVLPGSIVKTMALVAALEHGVITPESSHMCRRVAKADGQTYVCSHPDLKRPLSPAEALAYSCNDFFASLAPRLSREALNATRMAAGLPPIATNTPMTPAILGLAGPKTTPRALIDAIARIAGAGKDKAVPMKGLVVALIPAAKPTRAIVVAAPGGAGAAAAEIASDVIRGRGSFSSSDGTARGSNDSQSKPVGARPGQDPRGGVAKIENIPAPFFPRTDIRLGKTAADGSTQIQRIDLDSYVAQVLAGEGQPKAADAAQQVLAITARTFALANRNRHRSEGFDLCDTTHCQVVRPATAITRRAAEATSGRVLLHQGQPAFVFYSAWCGGKSELASQVWPGAIDYAYEPAQHDDACEDEPGWQSEVRADVIERALRTAGLRGSRLRNLRVLSRNTSGRIARIAVEGFTPGEISGNEFRMAVGRIAGWQSIKSTSFDIDRTSTGYRFEGRGFGHGVGLCVIGAGRRAAKGATADQILKFYFPGLSVGPFTAAAPTMTAAAPPKKAVPAPAADVALALPGNEEDERQAVLSLIRRSRDEILKSTGATAPQRLRVTVHPSVESFGRTTGQPWWVSGATDGAAIDLLPIAILRQQGQLDRTIRHEITHALLDGALSKRPMWVREGAAAYFARPQPLAKPDRVECPSDAELTRPVSAGAQRDAYARAEICFARGIAAGQRWDQIR
jgi:SpoIID/LytB domain protein